MFLKLLICKDISCRTANKSSRADTVTVQPQQDLVETVTPLVSDQPHDVPAVSETVGNPSQEVLAEPLDVPSTSSVTRILCTFFAHVVFKISVISS